ncbi:MAG: hypothetical protein IPN42_03520 [Methylococcaceae bacterium]|nr:hypothetical protein [Methylococcaceae bacterium]
MKKLTRVSAIALFLASMTVFAEPHLEEAITHTAAAVEQGKTGHSAYLVEHAKPALEHAMAASVVAKGHSKTKIEDAIKDLEEAIKHGELLHADVATTYVEAALEDLRVANKK